jgi:hypothetical protein
MVHCISLAYWFVFYLLRKGHDESQTKLLDIDKVYVSCVIHHNLCVHPHICLEHLYLWCIQFRLTAPNANAQPNHEERHFLPLRVWSCSQYLEDMQPYQDPRIIVRHARAFAGGPEPRARERPALKKKMQFYRENDAALYIWPSHGDHSHWILFPINMYVHAYAGKICRRFILAGALNPGSRLTMSAIISGTDWKSGRNKMGANAMQATLSWFLVYLPGHREKDRHWQIISSLSSSACVIDHCLIDDRS